MPPPTLPTQCKERETSHEKPNQSNHNGRSKKVGAHRTTPYIIGGIKLQKKISMKQREHTERPMYRIENKHNGRQVKTRKYVEKRQ